MNKILKTIGTLAILLAITAGTTYGYSWNKFKEDAEKLKTNVGDFVDDVGYRHDKLNDWKHTAQDWGSRAKTRTEELADSLRDFFTRDDVVVAFDVQKFKSDVELFYHYSALAVNIWELKHETLGVSEASIDALKLNIEKTKARLSEIAGSPDSKGLSLELIDQYQPTAEQVDATKLCQLDSPICQDSFRDNFSKATHKLNEFWTHYGALFPEVAEELAY